MKADAFPTVSGRITTGALLAAWILGPSIAAADPWGLGGNSGKPRCGPCYIQRGPKGFDGIYSIVETSGETVEIILRGDATDFDEQQALDGCNEVRAKDARCK